MAEENRVQIFINEKEMLYSHQNMARAINSFLPYLTNDDLNELIETLVTLKDHRREKNERLDKEKDNGIERKQCNNISVA
jgi:hypothetical protein